MFYHFEVAHPADRKAVVIGSGPNGLTAALTLARAGYAVTLYEQSERIGGGARSAELTLPGFIHDICSAIHPLAVSSPAFRQFPLDIDWVHPDAPLAHPLDDGSAVMLERSLDATCEGLGEDGAAWRKLMQPLAEDWSSLQEDVLAPVRMFSHPWQMARFGWNALRSAESLVRHWFRGRRARALFAGLAGHSLLALNVRPSAAFGLVLGVTGHTVGWPFPRGGAQKITDALAGCLRSLGGEIRSGSPVHSIPEARIVMCDVTPRQFLALASERLPAGYRRKLERYRYGPGAFKLDWALDGPIPWTAKECGRAGTLHLGGTFEEIALSERAAWTGGSVKRPYVLLAQHSLFDASRAPAGKHTAWAYCHVPNGSTVDMTEQVEAQVERFAPGFRKLILARSVMPPAALESRNPNLVGGDINGGASHMPQLMLRPSMTFYRTPLNGVFLCSASTPPGGGVHGMCGYNAALAALKLER
jgi:phytoene dehydrogenase-like protein